MPRAARASCPAASIAAGVFLLTQGLVSVSAQGVLAPHGATPSAPRGALAETAAAGSRNVLLVIADDLGVDVVGAYGEHAAAPPTPTLDALAAGGVLFRNAWADPVCGPSRACLLTGRHAARTGFGHGTNYDTQPWEVPLSELTLAELVRPVARTAAVGKWHMASALLTGLDHPRLSGFAHFRGSMKELGGMTGAGYSSWTRVVDGVPAPCSTYATTQEVDDALALIEGFGAAPWFLWLALHAPHSPYHAPPAALHTQVLPADVPSSMPQHYRAMVQAMDTELGRLLASMDPAVRARTVVIFVGDNGTPVEVTLPPFPPEHAKGTVYEGGLNVPLIVAGPGVAAGAECAALVHLTDVYATVGELLGAPASAAEDSVSFAPLLAQPGLPSPRATVYAEMFMPNGASPHVVRRRAVRDARFKLVHVHKKSTLPTERRLYDLAADPFEQHDLLGAPLDAAAQAAWLALEAELAEPALAWHACDAGLAGTAGPPVLGGSGAAAAGAPFQLALQHARPAAPSVLVLGLTRSGDAALGGVLSPRPDALVPVATDALGQLTLGGVLPAFLPPGASLVFQVWVADPAGPQGWAASNGLAVDVH